MELNCKTIICVLALVALTSCGKETEGGETQNTDKSELRLICKTNNATDITENSVVLSATSTIQNAKAVEGKACFYYSETELDADYLRQSGYYLSAESVSSDGGKFSAKIIGLHASTTYYYAAFVFIDGQVGCGEVKSFTTLESTEPGKDPVTPEAIDLGLSVKWATFNIGASKPEEYGDYFAWGEMVKKDGVYKWTNYKWCNGTVDTITKYTKTDGLSVLELGESEGESIDDAARAQWGGLWRMPTEYELLELLDPEKCQWEWTSLNGINGYYITSLVPGYGDRSIFLPAAGLCGGTGVNNVGDYGVYWTSSLYTEEESRAIFLQFDKESAFRSKFFRFRGQTIRPVSE